MLHERSKPGNPHQGGCRPIIRKGKRTCGSVGPHDAGEQSSPAPEIGLRKKEKKIITCTRICSFFFSMWLWVRGEAKCVKERSDLFYGVIGEFGFFIYGVFWKLFF